MNDKTWLIRTVRKKILGPISKEQVIEFIEKNALSKDDEIVSGNGYWFSIKEKDLLDKYLYGDLRQSFNPISEAVSVLSIQRRSSDKTASSVNIPGLAKPNKAKAGTVAKTPCASDLEYPDDLPDASLKAAEVLGQAAEAQAPKPAAAAPKKQTPIDSQVQDTAVIKLDPSEAIPSQEDLEYPDIEELTVPSPGIAEFNEMDLKEIEPEPEPEVESEPESAPEPIQQKEAPMLVEDVETADHELPSTPLSDKPNVKQAQEFTENKKAQEQKVSTRKEVKRSKKSEAKVPAINENKNDRYLIYLLGVLILIVLGAFFYMKKVMAQPATNVSFISSGAKKKV
jgi:hypothetical protein